MLKKTWWKTKWKRIIINRLDIDKNQEEDSNKHRFGADRIPGKRNTTKKDTRKGGEHTQSTDIGEKGVHVRVKGWSNRRHRHKGRIRTTEGNIGKTTHKEHLTQDNIVDHIHILYTLTLHRMDNDEGGEKECMRQDDGEKTKHAGNYAEALR